MRRGVTLPELMSVVVIVGIIATIAMAPLKRALDRAMVDEAVDRYVAMHETARQLAVARANLVRLEVDTAQRLVTVSVRRGNTWDTVQVHPLGMAHAATAQPVVTFAPFGFGWGLSNTSIVMARGTVAETLTVSRSGRLKRR